MTAAGKQLELERTVDRLRAVQQLLMDTGNEDAVWMAGVLEYFLDGETFETAAGLKCGQDWRKLAAGPRRNRSIFETAIAHFRWDMTDADVPRVSRELAGDLARLNCRILPQNRPQEHALALPGSRRRALLEILLASTKPLGRRQIARILRDIRCPSNVPARGASSHRELSEPSRLNWQPTRTKGSCSK